MEKNKVRPKYLNLFRIRMPVTAVVSIAHRISGFLLVVSIPALLYVFQMSLESAQSYNKIITYLDNTAVKCVLIVVVWSMAHHLVAGIRFLLIDLDIGVSKQKARRSAWLVHAIALTFTAYIAGLLS